MLSSILMVLGVIIALVLVLVLVASAVTNEGATNIAQDGKVALQAEAALELDFLGSECIDQCSSGCPGRRRRPSTP